VNVPVHLILVWILLLVNTDPAVLKEPLSLAEIVIVVNKLVLVETGVLVRDKVVAQVRHSHAVVVAPKLAAVAARGVIATEGLLVQTLLVTELNVLTVKPVQVLMELVVVQEAQHPPAQILIAQELLVPMVQLVKQTPVEVVVV
jgi:hypothetical protein